MMLMSPLQLIFLLFLPLHLLPMLAEEGRTPIACLGPLEGLRSGFANSLRTVGMPSFIVVINFALMICPHLLFDSPVDSVLFCFCLCLLLSFLPIHFASDRSEHSLLSGWHP